MFYVALKRALRLPGPTDGDGRVQGASCTVQPRDDENSRKNDLFSGIESYYEANTAFAVSTRSLTPTGYHELSE